MRKRLGSHGSFFHLTDKRKTHRFVDAREYPEFVGNMEKAFEALVATQSAAAPKKPE